MQTVRINRKGAWCSGTLIAPDLTPRESAHTSWVLTCGHFFRGHDGPFRIGSRKVVEVKRIPGTDIAVVKVDRQFPRHDLPLVSAVPLRGGRRVTVRGHLPRFGTMLASIPLAFSKQRTLVRPAGLVWARARKGDSGGAVEADGVVYATQALILGPLATVNQLAPHWHALREAMR